MTTCYCDGPGHRYDSAWCREGRAQGGVPISKRMAAARLELEAARLRLQADEER